MNDFASICTHRFEYKYSSTKTLANLEGIKSPGMRLNNYIASPHDIQISGKDYVIINMHADMHTYGLVGQRAQIYEKES